MRPLHYIHTLFSFCIIATLMVALGTSCTNDNTGNDDVPTSKYNSATPETRAARMRKALRETSKGQEMHRKIVENALKQAQNLLHECELRKITTAECRVLAESTVRNWEEQAIKKFASHNCYLRIDPLMTSSKSASLRSDRELEKQESLFKEGVINEEEIGRARTKVRLAKEEDQLSQALTRLLISANNFG
jgi:hypothetical protein